MCVKTVNCDSNSWLVDTQIFKFSVSKGKKDDVIECIFNLTNYGHEDNFKTFHQDE